MAGWWFNHGDDAADDAIMLILLAELVKRKHTVAGWRDTHGDDADNNDNHHHNKHTVAGWRDWTSRRSSSLGVGNSTPFLFRSM